MNSVSGSSGLTARVVLASAFLAFVAIMPSHAAAQSVSSQTQQLIPPGQNTCQAISVTNVTPYVYNGVLESFDVTISDTSNGYVGILASVGSTPISLESITRWAGEPGLRIHVDTPDMRVGTGLPVSLVLLSSLPNQPTCITSIGFEVTGMGVTTAAAPNPISYIGQSTSNSAPSQSYPVQSTAPSTVSSSKSGSTATAGKPATQTSSSTMASATSTALGASVVSASNAKFFSNICVGSNAYKLWFILLAIYVIIVAIVVFAEPWYLETSVIGSTAAILVPLILLLGFWYFSEACRAAAWIPVAACVIAIIGLFLAFREYETPPLLPASTNT